MMDDSALRERYLSVLDRLGEAIARAGRKPEEVRLIAVSKLHPAEDVACVAAAGQVDFGENYVQEALQKRQDLVAQPQCRDIRWHMIGHVQSRKAAQVAGAFALVHTLDSVKLADALEKRAAALLAAGVDVLVLDSAHGHSMNIVNKLKEIKAAYPSLDVVVGNIATAGAARFLIENGADGIKVGIGPGSICTTRVIAGVGVPQLSAIYAAASAAKDTGVPVIADGGLRYSGDIVKALAAGGDCVMIGSMFAGTEESPGETIIYNGRKFKTYRGMGSIDAMKAGSADRYFQKGCEGNINKLVPEGIVARVPFKGTLSEAVFQLIGGIRSGMGYCGARDIAALQRAQFIRITSNGVTENHPHDVTITSETPNYSRGE